MTRPSAPPTRRPTLDVCARFLPNRASQRCTSSSATWRGHAIARRLDQVSKGVVQVPQGSLYPDLHRFENRGLLAADWKPTDTGREAKFYRLTRKGKSQLETEAAGWRRLTVAVGLILNLSDGGAQ